MFAVLLLITVLFYWKFLLTHQFSLLTGGESANQAYAWYNFSVGEIKSGTLPVWDPYTQSGRTYSGEMQTGAFYPVNFLLALVPFNHNGVFSPQLYHWMYALTHVLGAWFMACLIFELGLGWFAALVAGICFSLGGFLARVSGWPHMFQSGIWLPLIVLFLLRALKGGGTGRTLLNASLSGCCLGMSVLAGGLHLVVMQGLVAVSVVVFHYWRVARDSSERISLCVRRAALLALAVVGVGLLAGAIQLLPSMEYSGLSIRWFGPGASPATQRIPYAYMSDGFWPHGLLQFLFFQAYNGIVGPGAEVNPYIGVFPLFLAIVGVWKYRDRAWVRYFVGLAACAAIYALAGMSFLHGIAYALVPFVWMAREPSRFLYLADFSIAILAAFGIEALIARAKETASWDPLLRVSKWGALAAGVALAVPAIYGRPEMNPWISFSLILIIASHGLLRYIVGRPGRRWAQFLVLAIILFDLHAADWSADNKIRAAEQGADHLERVLGCRKMAGFLKSRPGAYRTEVISDPMPEPNIGDLFGIETTGGAAVTMLQDYERFWAHIDLLSVRYKVRPASSQEPGTVVYQDANWKVYERPSAYPRAWLVHDVIVERDPQKQFKRLDDPQIDLHRTALVGEPLGVKLDPPGTDSLDLSRYNGKNLELDVDAGSRGLLVLSEIYYPGWKATINGQPARIWKVNGALRGILVPPGKSRIEMHYAPVSVHLGGLLSLGTFVGVLAAAWLLRRTRQAERAAAATAALE